MDIFLSHARLREIRMDQHLTQEEFANALGIKGIKQRQITDMERNNKKIGSNVALKIEELYGVNFKWTLTGDGPKYVKDNDSAKKLKEDKNIIGVDLRDYANPDELMILLRQIKEFPPKWYKTLNAYIEEKLKVLQ